MVSDAEPRAGGGKLRPPANAAPTPRRTPHRTTATSRERLRAPSVLPRHCVDGGASINAVADKKACWGHRPERTPLFGGGGVDRLPRRPSRTQRRMQSPRAERWQYATNYCSLCLSVHHLSTYFPTTTPRSLVRIESPVERNKDGKPQPPARGGSGRETEPSQARRRPHETKGRKSAREGQRARAGGQPRTQRPAAHTTAQPHRPCRRSQKRKEGRNNRWYNII